jgi:hypothetical protein
MTPFKTFVTEKKAYTLNSQDNKQLEDIFQEYQKYFSSEAIGNHDPVQAYKGAIKDDRIYLGTIKYYDSELKENNQVDVYVSFESFAADASYNKSESVIELFYYNFSKLPPLQQRNKIAHELLHAKQHYKTITPSYRKALQKRSGSKTTIRSERGYFFAPNEYPVQVASIIHEMDRQYRLILQKVKAGSNAKFWDNQRRGFLRLLEQFIRSPKLMSDNDIPNYLKNETRFLKALFRNKDNPKYSRYYRDFKQKMYWYYQKLRNLKANEREPEDNLPES